MECTIFCESFVCERISQWVLECEKSGSLNVKIVKCHNYVLEVSAVHQMKTMMASRL